MTKNFQIAFACSILVLAFQNCSKVGFAESPSTAVGAPVKGNGSSPEPTSDTSPASGDGTSPTSPATGAPPADPASVACKDADAISVFAWANAATDPMKVAPQLGAKLATVKIDQGGGFALNPFANVAWPSAMTGWRVSSVRTVDSQNRSVVTLFFNKQANLDNSEQMTCSYGPVVDSSCNVSAPTAKITYQNVGVGLNGVDGFQGFLSCAPKFIACKIANSTRSTAFVNLANEKANVPSTTSFVVKRGCGKAI